MVSGKSSSLLYQRYPCNHVMTPRTHNALGSVGRGPELILKIPWRLNTFLLGSLGLLAYTPHGTIDT